MDDNENKSNAPADLSSQPSHAAVPGAMAIRPPTQS